MKKFTISALGVMLFGGGLFAGDAHLKHSPKAHDMLMEFNLARMAEVSQVKEMKSLAEGSKHAEKMKAWQDIGFDMTNITSVRFTADLKGFSELKQALRLSESNKSYRTTSEIVSKWLMFVEFKKTPEWTKAEELGEKYKKEGCETTKVVVNGKKGWQVSLPDRNYLYVLIDDTNLIAGEESAVKKALALTEVQSLASNQALKNKLPADSETVLMRMAHAPSGKMETPRVKSYSGATALVTSTNGIKAAIKLNVDDEQERQGLAAMSTMMINMAKSSKKPLMSEVQLSSKDAEGQLQFDLLLSNELLNKMLEQAVFMKFMQLGNPDSVK